VGDAAEREADVADDAVGVSSAAATDTSANE
jgi:hypothetical protein